MHAEDSAGSFINQRGDLATLNILFPGLDGYEFADLTRKSGTSRGVRHVAISGFGQAVDRGRNASAESAAHFFKSLAPDALALLLHT